MASKAITVKVPTAKVITALQAKLEKIELDFASQESNDAQYQNAMEAWRKEIGKWAIDRFSKASNIRTNYREWNKTLNVDFDITVDEKEFPKEPVREHDKIHLHEYKEMKEDITNALSILRMTEEETVNASTMKSIARYL
jgi:hypothetical protein